MKNLPKFFISVIGCQLIGLLGTPFTISAIPTWYAYLNKPFFAPPNWIFGPVWTILYFMMGVSFFLIWKLESEKKNMGIRELIQVFFNKIKGSKNSSEKRKSAQKYFLIQLGLNFIWSPVFFGLRSPFIALFIIAAMWFFIVLTIKKFYPLSKLSAYLLVPYLLWVSFASILNLAIVILN